MLLSSCFTACMVFFGGLKTSPFLWQTRTASMCIIRMKDRLPKFILIFQRVMGIIWALMYCYLSYGVLFRQWPQRTLWWKTQLSFLKIRRSSKEASSATIIVTDIQGLFLTYFTNIFSVHYRFFKVWKHYIFNQYCTCTLCQCSTRLF